MMSKIKLNIKLNTKSVSAIVGIILALILMLLFKIGYERIQVFVLIYLLCLLISKHFGYALIGSIVIFAIVNLMIGNKKFIEKFENEIDSEDTDEGFEDNENKEENDQENNNEGFEDNDESGVDEETENKKENKINNKKIIKKTKEEVDEIEDKETFENDDEISFSPEVKKASENIKNMLKKANGGIKLSEEDLEETEPMGVNTEFFSNDKKPNALRDAQMETYALIDTVSALKDTIETLNPVLSEGKKLMNMFESVRL